jgi:cell shape-determining protein MreD
MRWLLVTILAYGCLVIETAVFRPGGLAVQVDQHWARPDLMLVIGLFLAFYFEPAQVFAAGWCLGLASDLVSVAGRLGLKAMLFCLLLAAVSAIRSEIPRTRIWVQFAAALVLVFVVHLAWYAVTRLASGAGLWLVRSGEEAVLDGLYSAVLAPYLFWGFTALRGPLRIAVQSLNR